MQASHLMNIPRVSILGVKVSVLNMELALTQMQTWINDRVPAYVCVAPAHSIMECVNEPDLLPIFNSAGMITPDGMAVVWLMRLKGYSQVDRVYGPDLLLSTSQYGLDKGWRHFFYGGGPGVASDLVNHLQTKFPDLQIAGTYTPPFRQLTPEEDQQMIALINASNADLVWVGLSSPKQEIWMHDHVGQLNPPVLLGVGAAFDFLSGRKPQAPLWVQRSGFEWFFRLVSEPRRLWPRYKQYPRFIILVSRELIREHFIRETK